MKRGNVRMKYEMKKIIIKPVNKFVFFLTTIIVIAFAILAIKDVSFVTSEGENIYGITAAKRLREQKNDWKGYLTDDVLLAVYNLDKECELQGLENSNDEIENEKKYAKAQGAMDIRDLVNEAFSGPDEYDYYKISKLDKAELSSFYSTRRKDVDEYLDSTEGGYSEAEKNYVLNKYSEMQMPLYYADADGWKTLLKAAYFPSILIVIILAIGFLVSGIFSDEFKYHADDVFFSTKQGRNKAIIKKICTGIITITVVYWFEVLVFTSIVLGTLGFDGANCLIETDADNWRSIYNISFVQEYWITVIGAYIGCLFILTLSMYVSIKTKQALVAVTIPFFFACVCPFLGRVTFLTKIVNLLPGQLLQLNTLFKYIYLYTFGGKVFGLIELVVILYLILSLMMIPSLYFSMKKIRGR